ncbi:uncharacterized protein LOC125044445 [Penaeus chinensis]|uniref:uncharacterized protein LOC125044445 n=1 Tax=Penaeus chinensis TaxID=139456 RepID=UPI001FB585D8|nr:uncharacterized protein LOC125044445 [Penaeus chinensis]
MALGTMLSPMGHLSRPCHFLHVGEAETRAIEHENENPDNKATKMLTVARSAALLTLALLTSGLRAEQEDLQQIQQTRELTIEKILHTAVSTSTYTVVVYPTCTTSVAGVSACRDAHVPNLSHMIHPEASRAPLRGSVTALPAQDGSESSTYEVAEVVMPSCDCPALGDAPSSSFRSARLLQDQVITIRSTTVLTHDVLVTSTDHATTVSITYNGCVPPDAPATATCDA